MSSGPKNVTSTTETAPPSYLAPFLATAGNAAAGAFTGQSPGAIQQMQGPQIPGNIPANKLSYFQGKFGEDLSGANPQQQARMQNKFGIDFSPQPIPMAGQPSTAGTDRDYTLPGQGGQDLIGQGQGLISDTLAGNFLSPSSNPYLDATFNRGADQITNRLNSSFARSGRDLAAGRPAAADDLGSFASQLYGDNYRFERGNQMGALGQSQQFDPLNLFINRLAGIIPNAGGVTSSQQPVFKTGLF